MLNAQDRFDKQVLNLGRERRALERRRLVLVPLDPPIQRGWRRFHVLTAKAEKFGDKDVLAAILERIGTVMYHNSPEFRRKRGRGKRRRFVEIEQPPREITVGEWQAHRLPDEWIPYFRLETRCHFRHWRDALVFDRPYVFELKVEPNWVTEVRVPDPAIQRQISEINRWFENHQAWYRYHWLKGDRNWCEIPARQQSIDREHRREIARAYRDFPEVDPAASVRRSRVSFRCIIFIFPGVAQ